MVFARRKSLSSKTDEGIVNFTFARKQTLHSKSPFPWEGFCIYPTIQETIKRMICMYDMYVCMISIHLCNWACAYILEDTYPIRRLQFSSRNNVFDSKLRSSFTRRWLRTNHFLLRTDPIKKCWDTPPPPIHILIFENFWEFINTDWTQS